MKVASMKHRAGWVLLVSALAGNNSVWAGEEPGVTPYRPTLSNPADLSVPGWLELEMGWQRVEGGGDTQRDSMPLLAKLAFSENWGVLLGSELAIRRVDDAGQVFSGNGDITVMIKHRIPAADENTAWGIEAGGKSPTAPDTLGSGKTDYIVNGIYSTSLAGNQMDINLSATRLGLAGAGESDAQYGWALALSRGLDERWGIFGELSGNARSGANVQGQFMTGGTYTVDKRIVLDVGLSWGVNKFSADRTLFAGISVLAGKLW